MTSQSSSTSYISKRSIIAIAAASAGAVIIFAIISFYPTINLSDDVPTPGSDIADNIDAPELGSGQQSTLPSAQTGENPVIAEVNGEEIYLQELRQAKTATQAQTGQGVESTVLLAQLITNELLLQEAENRDISVTAEEAKASLEEQIVQNGMEVDQFKKSLQSQGTTYDDTIDLYQEQLTINELLTDETSSGSMVSESEKESFFDENMDAIKGQFGDDVAYEDVADMIEATILQQKQQGAVMEFVNQLRGNAEIITYEDRLD